MCAPHYPLLLLLLWKLPACSILVLRGRKPVTWVGVECPFDEIRVETLLVRLDFEYQNANDAAKLETRRSKEKGVAPQPSHKVDRIVANAVHHVALFIHC